MRLYNLPAGQSPFGLLTMPQPQPAPFRQPGLMSKETGNKPGNGWSSAISQGLLGLGIGLLKNNTKSPMQALGPALEHGLMSYNTERKHSMARKMAEREQAMQDHKMGMQAKRDALWAPGNKSSGAVPSMSAIMEGIRLGDPRAKQFLDAHKYTSAGIKQEGGAYYKNPLDGKVTYMPQIDKGMHMAPDGTVMPLRGYDEAMARRAAMTTQATERAKAGYDLQPVYQPDGSQTYATRGQIVQGLQPTSMHQQGQYVAAPNPMSAEAQKELNSDWINNSYKSVREQAEAANGMLNSVQAMRGINLETGWGTETKVQGLRLLNALGLADEEAQDTIADFEKFKTVSMTRLMTMLQAQKGPQTEGDADRAAKTFASVENTPQANEFILDMAQATAERERQRLIFYDSLKGVYARKGNLAEIDTIWLQNAPSIYEHPAMQKWQ